MPIAKFQLLHSAAKGQRFITGHEDGRITKNESILFLFSFLLARCLILITSFSLKIIFVEIKFLLENIICENKAKSCNLNTLFS